MDIAGLILGCIVLYALFGGGPFGGGPFDGALCSGGGDEDG